MAIEASLRMDKRLGGLVALSTWFTHEPQPAQPMAQQGLPALVCHGGSDVEVPTRMGSEAGERLKSMGLATLVKKYEMMGHAFCSQVTTCIIPVQSGMMGHALCSQVLRAEEWTVY